MLATASGLFTYDIYHPLASSSTLRLSLTCAREVHLFNQEVIVYTPTGPRTVIIPSIVRTPCAAPCDARFSHLGRIKGSVYSSPNLMLQEHDAWAVNDDYPLLDVLAHANSSYDKTATATVDAPITNVNAVYAQGLLMMPEGNVTASALLRNGHAHAMHARLSCPTLPATLDGAVWSWGSSMGPPYDRRLKATLRDWFKTEWNLDIQP
jgi:hypothetical protein